MPKRLPIDRSSSDCEKGHGNGDPIQIEVIRRPSVDQSKLNMDNENVQVNQMAKIFRI
jgi:hypothetical protein